MVCFPSALFQNSSSCGALRNRAEPRHRGQWPPSPWERSWLSALPPPRASPLLPSPPLPPQMLGTKASQLSVSSPVRQPRPPTPSRLLEKEHLKCSGCWQKGAGGSPVVLTEVAGGAAGGHPGLEAAARGRVSSQGPSPGDQRLQLFSHSFAQSTCKSLPGSEAYCRSELNPLGVGKDWGAGMPRFACCL